jgi:hypothetical protein
MTSSEASTRVAIDALLDAHRADIDMPATEARGRFGRDAILRAIHDWGHRYGELPKSYDWDPAWARRRGEEWRAERFEAGDWPSLAMVRRQFGNLSNALYAAGERPRGGRTRKTRRVVTDDDILDAIRRWAERYGEPPTRADWSPARAVRHGQQWRVDRYRAGDWPSFSTVVRRYGTLTAAVQAAGLEPRMRGHHGRSRPGMPAAARGDIALQLLDGQAVGGPGIVATRVRRVSEARMARDVPALRGALLDLAAAAVTWADSLEDRAA